MRIARILSKTSHSLVGLCRRIKLRRAKGNDQRSFQIVRLIINEYPDDKRTSEYSGKHLDERRVRHVYENGK